MKKRIAAISLCGILSLSMLLTACNGSEGTESTGDSSRPTIKILTVQRSDSNYPIEKESVIKTAIEEKSGFNMDIEAIEETNYGDIMNTRLAAGLNLPDIMFTGYSDSLKPAQNGLYLPVNDLIEDYAPNLKNVLYGEYDVVRRQNIAPDGKLYWIPGISLQTYQGNIIPSVHGVGIRKDWLDKCSLAVPTTTEEFYQALKAFQENDCNGNGKKDEVFVSWFGFQDVMLAWFGIPQASITIAEDGKAKYIWNYENAYAYAEYMRKLYQEKLLDQQIFNVTGENILKRVTVNRAAAICYWADCSGFDAQTGDPNAEYVTMPPLRTDIGTAGAMKMNATGKTGANFAITKACNTDEKKINAIKFMDWFYSQEAQDMVIWGVEGVHCVKNEDGTYSEHPDFVARQENNATSEYDDVFDWVPCLPFMRVQDWETSNLKNANNQKALDRAQEVLTISLWEESVFATTEVALPTDEEEKLGTQYANEMGTYAIEMMTKFINGREDLNKTTWDAFQHKLLNDFHLQERLDIFETRYKRFQEN